MYNILQYPLMYLEIKTVIPDLKCIYLYNFNKYSPLNIFPELVLMVRRLW